MPKRLIFDVETDGLLPDLTRIHCMAVRDVDTNEVFSFVDHRQSKAYPTISEGIDLLRSADLVIGHNAIEFDVEALRKADPKLEQDLFRGKLYDTKVISRAVFTNLAANDYAAWERNKFPGHLLKKPHSLEAWGHRLKVFKGKYDGGWGRWSQDMHDYCIQDTNVTLSLFQTLERKEVPQRVIDIETELAWYLSHQERNGFLLDVKAAVDLYALLSGKRSEIGKRLIERFGSWWVSLGVQTPKRTATYRKDEIAPRLITEGAQYEKIELVEFNPDSREHIADRLIKTYNWKPTEFGDDGKPTMDEDTLKGLPYPEINDLCEYLMVSKRIGQLAEGKQAWLKLADGDGFVHGKVNQSGTATHRASHNTPNMTQVPKAKDSVPFGKECRALWTVPKGWKLVGGDVSGLELRGLGHYLQPHDGGAYIQIVTQGDVHTENWKAGAPYLADREMAKTFIYALIYGAQDRKLGSICEPSASEARQREVGAKLRAQFVKKTIGLDQLLAKIKRVVLAKKPLPLPSGHTVYSRAQHSALNYLIQGTGAVICKLWITLVDERLRSGGLELGRDRDWYPCVWAHDEIQIAVQEDYVDIVRDEMLAMIPKAGEMLGIRCPLAGEVKIGNNWSETH